MFWDVGRRSLDKSGGTTRVAGGGSWMLCFHIGPFSCFLGFCGKRIEMRNIEAFFSYGHAVIVGIQEKRSPSVRSQKLA